MGVSKVDDTATGRLLSATMADKGHDSVEDAQKALDEGADINAQDERSGQTALMAASLRGKPQLVKFLLAKGADPTIGENQGYTPQHGAGFQGRPDIMEILHDAGLDVNHVHTDGFTPFHRSCWGNKSEHTATVEFLLKTGVDVNLKGVGDKKETCMEMTKSEETKVLLRKYGAIEKEQEL